MAGDGTTHNQEDINNEEFTQNMEINIDIQNIKINIEMDIIQSIYGNDYQKENNAIFFTKHSEENDKKITKIYNEGDNINNKQAIQ